MSDVTALIPIHRTNHDPKLLDQAVRSLNIPFLLCKNDGEVEEALNAGAEAATTEFVLPFGADDVALPGMVDHLLGPSWNADVVYPAMVLTDEHLNPTGLHEAPPFCPHRLEQANYITGSSLIRRESLLRVGGFRALGGLEDWDLFVRMSRAGMRLKPSPEARFLYRIQPGTRNERARTDPTYGAEMRAKIVGDETPLLATFYNQATPATTYLRCQLPARHLPGAVHPEVYANVTDDGMEFPSHRGAAVFQFAGDMSRALTSLLMQQEGIRVLVEVDDNYLTNPGKAIRARQGWGMKIGEKAHSKQGHAAIVRDATGVIVTTPYLADVYRQANPNVYVCPNTVDPADWPDADDHSSDGVLRIAWFASKSHEEDIGLVAPAMEWAAAQPDVEVHTVGLNPAGYDRKFKDRWRFPFVANRWIDDLDAYRASFRYFDIGVAPVCRTPHSLGRSDVKALEYAMGLVAPVLSDVAPYSEWRDGETCLKADGARGFRRAIEHLVKNRDEAKQLAAAAREYVLAERTTVAQIDRWKEAVVG